MSFTIPPMGAAGRRTTPTQPEPETLADLRRRMSDDAMDWWESARRLYAARDWFRCHHPDEPEWRHAADLALELEGRCLRAKLDGYGAAQTYAHRCGDLTVPAQRFESEIAGVQSSSFPSLRAFYFPCPCAMALVGRTLRDPSFWWDPALGRIPDCPECDASCLTRYLTPVLPDTVNPPASDGGPPDDRNDSADGR